MEAAVTASWLVIWVASRRNCVRLKGCRSRGTTMVEPRMDVDHVGQAVVYMDSLPLDANVQFITVMATKMPFIGRG